MPPYQLIYAEDGQLDFRFTGDVNFLVLSIHTPNTYYDKVEYDLFTTNGFRDHPTLWSHIKRVILYEMQLMGIHENEYAYEFVDGECL